MIGKQERSRFKSVQIDNLKGLPGIRRMDKILHTFIRELCVVTKGVHERIDEDILRWFGHVERMKNDKIDRRVLQWGVQIVGQ